MKTRAAIMPEARRVHSRPQHASSTCHSGAAARTRHALTTFLVHNTCKACTPENRVNIQCVNGPTKSRRELVPLKSIVRCGMCDDGEGRSAPCVAVQVNLRRHARLFK